MLTLAHITGDQPITGGTLRLLLALTVFCVVGLSGAIAVAALGDLRPVILGPQLHDIVLL